MLPEIRRSQASQGTSFPRLRLVCLTMIPGAMSPIPTTSFTTEPPFYPRNQSVPHSLIPLTPAPPRGDRFVKSTFSGELCKAPPEKARRARIYFLFHPHGRRTEVPTMLETPKPNPPRRPRARRRRGAV